MKSIALAIGFAASLMASAAMAQSATQNPGAAATLPNAFDAPASGQPAPRATPQQPAQAQAPANAPAGAPASAPDIARAEEALREVITALRSGQIDYTMFSDDLAEKIRPQTSQIGSLLSQFGDLKTITHKGQPDGVDLFRVDFENQATEWVIGFDNDDQIAALLFRPAQ